MSNERRHRVAFNAITLARPAAQPGIPSPATAFAVQGSSIRRAPGCENAAGKLRQKWQATAGTKFTKPGACLILEPCISVAKNVTKNASNRIRRHLKQSFLIYCVSVKLLRGERIKNPKKLRTSLVIGPVVESNGSTGLTFGGDIFPAVAFLIGNGP